MPNETAKALAYVQSFYKSERQGKLVPKGTHDVRILKKAVKTLELPVTIEKIGDKTYLVKTS